MSDVPAPERTLGYSVIHWAEKWLLQPDGPMAGAPWRFTAEQAAFILKLYAIDAAGRFVHRRAVFRRSKGHGKSPLMAALAATELLGPCRFGGFGEGGMPKAIPHPAAWIQIVAVSLQQTTNTCSLFPALFSADAVREYGLDIGKEKIWARSGGRIEAVTSSPKSLEGGRPSLVVEDETSLWVVGTEGPLMNEVSERNLAKSRDGQALLIESSNAHLIDEDSIAERTFESWRKADGNLPGLLYDSVEAPVIRGLDDQPIPLADLTDDQVRAGLMIARGDSHWVDVERLLREVRDPKTSEGTARRFYLNQPTLSAFEEWVSAAAWQERARPDIVVPDGARIVIGVDGSFNSDSFAIVGCTIGPIPHLFVLACFEPDPKALYAELTTVPILDMEEVVRQACKRWRVKAIACDPHLLQRSMAIWQREGLPVVEIPQTERMITGAATTKQAVLNAQMTHDGDPRLARHVGNVVFKESYLGDRLVKGSRRTRRKIDLAIAAVIAFAQASIQRPGQGAAFMQAWDEMAKRRGEQPAGPAPQAPSATTPITQTSEPGPIVDPTPTVPPRAAEFLDYERAMQGKPFCAQHRFIDNFGNYRCTNCGEERPR